MTEPRPHYALPPPTDEPDERAAELRLWGACAVCGGHGLDRLRGETYVDDFGELAIRLTHPCPACKGSGCSADLE